MNARVYVLNNHGNGEPVMDAPTEAIVEVREAIREALGPTAARIVPGGRVRVPWETRNGATVPVLVTIEAETYGA